MILKVENRPTGSNLIILRTAQRFPVTRTHAVFDCAEVVFDRSLVSRQNLPEKGSLPLTIFTTAYAER
jgi:hypothetical protein